MHDRAATETDREAREGDHPVAGGAGGETDALDPGERPRSARVRLGVGAVVVLLLGALVVAVVASGLSQRGSTAPLPVAPGRSTATASAASGLPPGSPVFVHVLGAVRTPGLVSLGGGARVVDAVAAAGGLSDDADAGGVNLARAVVDGEQLYVPRAGESQPGGADAPPSGSASSSGGPAGARSGGKVDLNRATAADLESLPRIGPALAQRIVDWREANGRFQAVSDLQKVTGIGDKIFAGLKDLVSV